MDWSFQNEVEADWCLCALKHARKYAVNIRGTSWLFLGHMSDPLMCATVRFLTFASVQLHLNLDIRVLVYENAEIPDVSCRVDCIDTITEAVSADYCIYFAYSEDRRQENTVLSRMAFFWEKIAKPVHRAICISNQTVYSKYSYPIVAAEGEFHQNSSNPDCRFARRVEQIVCDLLSAYIILRPGVIVAPSLELDTVMVQLLQQLAEGQRIELSTRTQYSLVYFTDFLTALITTAAVGLDCEI